MPAVLVANASEESALELTLSAPPPPAAPPSYNVTNGTVYAPPSLPPVPGSPPDAPPSPYQPPSPDFPPGLNESTTPSPPDSAPTSPPGEPPTIEETPVDVVHRALVCYAPYAGEGVLRGRLRQDFSFGEAEEAVAALEEAGGLGALSISNLLAAEGIDPFAGPQAAKK